MADSLDESLFYLRPQPVNDLPKKITPRYKKDFQKYGGFVFTRFAKGVLKKSFSFIY